MKDRYDIVVVGGGPAGLAAAAAAYRHGARDILLLERDRQLGGILLQCIHSGFGLQYFKEELTGPEYAARFIADIRELGIACRTDTAVLRIDAPHADGTTEYTVTAVNPMDGLMTLRAKALILASGCRERTRGALMIPGSRPAGVFTAGTAQRFVNREGYLPGRNIVILGSGDIGLIMARRLTLEGADVKCICEVMPFSSGLARNIAQCADDFHIPIRYSRTVTRIHGANRVEGVTTSAVDDRRNPIPGTEEYIECDTLLLSVGLIPENEIAQACGIPLDPATAGPFVNERRETAIPGIFACGNAVHVHDIVDFVTEESITAGRSAAEDLLKPAYTESHAIPVRAGERVRYTVPQYLSQNAAEYPDGASIMFRSTGVYRGAVLTAYSGTERIAAQKKAVVRPGEMLVMHLSQEQLKKIAAQLTISIELPKEEAAQ